MAKKKEEKSKEPEKNIELEKDSVPEKDAASKPDIKKKQNWQVMWAVILMISVILILFLVPFIVKNFINKFTYINLYWQKTQLGDLRYYSVMIPVADKSGNITGGYSMNFKNDPRETGKIQFNTGNNSDPILFVKQSMVYITFDPDIKACGANNTIAFSDLAGFLGDFARLKYHSGTTDKNYSKQNKIPYVTCQNSPQSTVIYVDDGEKTEINKINDNCYELIYSNCEVLPVTERFMLIVMEKYMDNFKMKNKSFLNILK